MTKEQALAIISQVCAQFKGTLAEHHQIQAALKALSEK